MLLQSQRYCLTSLNAEKTCGVSFFPPDMFLVALIRYHILLWCSFSDSFAATILAASSGGIPWSKDSCPSSWINTKDLLKWDKVSCLWWLLQWTLIFLKSMLGYITETHLSNCKQWSSFSSTTKINLFDCVIKRGKARTEELDWNIIKTQNIYVWTFRMHL